MSASVDFIAEPEVREGVPMSVLRRQWRAILGGSSTKVHCGVDKWGPRWRVATCRLHAGHGPDVDHNDPLQGIRWPVEGVAS